ncbi:MAG: NAD(P)-dependent oxidoreductase [Candidatus Daviesbacteria bacterium]|nr:NAD(P)-dependent oxidoreductase [Candidatus Daviesbacteria bacterium]
MTPKKKLFITGASGFVGRHLVKKLNKRKYLITVLLRKKSDTPFFMKMGIKVILGDLTHHKTFIGQLNKCDILVNLAGIRANWGVKEEFFKINSEVIKKFFSKESSLKHIIITSSVYAMGRLSKIPADETSLLSGLGIYGKSKIRAEEITKELSSNFNIPYTIIRPAIIYGPNDNERGMLVKMISLVKNNRFLIIGNGKNLLHLIYIDDLVQGFINAIEMGGHNQTYILAAAKPITLYNLLLLIRKELNIKISLKYIPRLPVLLVAYIYELIYKIGFMLLPNLFKKEPFISPVKVYTLTDNFSYDTRKAKKELKFNPKIDYEKGIKNAIRAL